MRTVQSIAHHRNGVCGNPFHVAIVKDDDGTEKLCIRFEDSENSGPRCAVLDLDLLTSETGPNRIAFGVNSWRGDHYAECVDRAIAARNKD